MVPDKMLGKAIEVEVYLQSGEYYSTVQGHPSVFPDIIIVDGVKCDKVMDKGDKFHYVMRRYY